MALTAQEEALVRQLLDEQAAILSLAGSEATILSKLGATKVTLSDLTAVSTVADADLLLMRQGTTDKSLSALIFGAYAANSVPLGSETVAGKVEIATNAEAQAFTVNKIIDGAKLNTAFQGSNQSLSANGYQKLPGGLILQWMTMNSVASATTTGVWPIAFPNAVLFVGPGEVTEATGGYYFFQCFSSSLSGFSGAVYGQNPGTAPALAGSFPFKIFAIGN